jgi:hypothetical protein
MTYQLSGYLESHQATWWSATICTKYEVLAFSKFVSRDRARMEPFLSNLSELYETENQSCTMILP